MASAPGVIPKEFVMKRLHTLTGIWFVIYLTMHLFTNSQAALMLGDDGQGFIHSVNSIHELPYLPVIEIVVLAFPILIHGIWGIYYAYRAKFNSFGGGGAVPYLPDNPRNRAYTWQRITAWLLVFGIIAHVIHMRFIEYPASAELGDHHFYMIRVSADDGLYTLADRLGFGVYDKRQVEQLRKESLVYEEKTMGASEYFKAFFASLIDLLGPAKVSDTKVENLLKEQRIEQKKHWIEALEKRPLKEGEVIAIADNFGTVELLMVRDTFKMPIMIVLYSLLVITACFHAFNGLWTSMISLGITLSRTSQIVMTGVSTLLMIAVTLLGLAAVWLTYWINLKQ